MNLRRLVIEAIQAICVIPYSSRSEAKMEISGRLSIQTLLISGLIVVPIWVTPPATQADFFGLPEV
jgi:hypothetical protein